jgi:tol-pal system-associated acyl-CoA thioesterase
VSEAEFSLPLRVYIEDTDAGGIVYYVNYLKYMERCRTEFMRALGYGKNFIFSEDLMFVVSDVAVQYRRPAKLDDELLATARVSKLGGAAMTFSQSVTRADELLAEGQIKVVCAGRTDLKPRRIPKQMLVQLRSTQ